VKITKNNKTIYLFTSNFPYATNETFLETEIQYLSSHFKKIIVVSFDIESQTSRSFPCNVSTIRVRYELNRFEKIMSIGHLFSNKIWFELIHVRKNYKKPISFGILKTAFFSLTNAKRLVTNFQKLGIINHNSIYYSYWSNDCSIALCLLKSDSFISKAISRAHGWDVFFKPSKYNYLPFRNLILTHLDRLYVVSEAGGNYIQNKWKSKFHEKVFVSRLGVRRNQFSEKSSRKSLLLVSCSNIIPLKRIDLMAETLSLINSISIKWVHFGDGILLDTIEQLCSKILLPNVEFEFKGRVENSKVLEYYYTANPDLFMNLSSSEGIPVSIMEAMSFGIPVIATDVGGSSEIVNSENGFLLSSNPEPEEVAQVIHDFNNFNELDKTKMRNNAFETWNEKYNSEKNYSAFVEDIASL
jgi:glycosyltransferase involved in cell wall biosynthesis